MSERYHPRIGHVLQKICTKPNDNSTADLPWAKKGRFQKDRFKITHSSSDICNIWAHWPDRKGLSDGTVKVLLKLISESVETGRVIHDWWQSAGVLTDSCSFKGSKEEPNEPVTCLGEERVVSSDGGLVGRGSLVLGVLYWAAGY